MWNTALAINSVLWTLAATFFIYSIGASILLWTPKPLEVSFIVGLILTGSEVVIAFFLE